MGNQTNQAGVAAILGAIVVIATMVLYKVALGGDTTVAVGMSIVALATAAFIFLFYSRMNTVQRTGTMSLVFVVVVAVLLPIFLFTSNAKNTDAATRQYQNKLTYAAGLFTTYCASCHGLLGQGISGPQLNGSDHMKTYTYDDVNRIITSGIVDSANPTVYLMPQWSQRYGGPFNDDDVNSLATFVLSSTQQGRDKLKSPNSTNGFSLIYPLLQQALDNATTNDAKKTAQTAIDNYKNQEAAANRPKDAPIDLTAQTAVTVPIINAATEQAGWGFIYTDPTSKATSHVIKIKVGTKVTFENQSSAPHNVVSDITTGPQADFKSPPLINQTESWTYTFTQPGDYPYHCGLHPAMKASIEVVP